MGRRPGSSSVQNVPLAALHAELRRREHAVKKLRRKHAIAMNRVAAIESQLIALGAVASGGGGGGRGRGTGAATRARNDMNLVESLVKVLTGKTMGVTEVADAVQRAGYKTSSPNFRTIVNQTLIKSDKFKRVGRGQYTAK